MNQIVALDPKAHQHIKIDPQKINAHAASQHSMPLIIDEIERASVCYPIVFTKRQDTGAFSCIALLGFEKEENLYWVESRWQASYIPMNVKRQPFFIGAEEAKPSNIVCFDRESDALASDHGIPLFEAEGSPSEYLLQVRSMLSALLQGEDQCQQFINKLIELELIMPLSLDIRMDDANKLEINGLYTIDEKRLGQLSSHHIFSLFNLGELKKIYAMINSLHLIADLIERKKQRIDASAAWYQ